MIRVVVGAQSGLEQVATRLASDFGLPLLSTTGKHSDVSLILEIRKDCLALVPTDRVVGKALRIDFVSGSTAYRRLSAGTTRQPLAKAIGLRQGCRSVVDATAGLGRDSFQLACLNLRISAIERSPVLVAMLQDAIQRARKALDRKLVDIAARMSVIWGDSRELLARLSDSERPDVVYLDPMYTPSGSSALAKKEMRILRILVGGDEDADELLGVARRVARKRVVVKRHLRAPALAEDVSVSFPGRTVRYDVYLIPEGK